MEIRVPPLIGPVPVPRSWPGPCAKRSSISSPAFLHQSSVCGLHPGRSHLSHPDRHWPQGHARAKIPGMIPCQACAAPPSFCTAARSAFGFAQTTNSGEIRHPRSLRCVSPARRYSDGRRRKYGGREGLHHTNRDSLLDTLSLGPGDPAVCENLTKGVLDEGAWTRFLVFARPMEEAKLAAAVR
jgi:hypothetical protein